MLPWIVLLLIVLVAGGAAYYFWRSRLNIPDLSYTLLPPYEIPDVILVGGLMVENRGRQPAPNVKVTIQFDGDAATMIHHLKVSSTENAVLRSGGERHTFATISARSVRPQGKVFVNWAAARDAQPKVTLTSYTPTKETLLDKLLPRKTDI